MSSPTNQPQQQWTKDIIKEIIMLMQEKNKYNGNFLTEGYKYTVNAVIDNYSQTYFVENKGNISIFQKYHKYREGIYENILMSENAWKKLEEQKNKYEDADRIKEELIDSINKHISDKNKLLSTGSLDHTLKKRIDDYIDNSEKEEFNILFDEYKRLKEEIENLKKENVKNLHGEHLTPQSYTRKILNNLLLNLQNGSTMTNEDIEAEIGYAFRDCKICIITKDESLHLDGKNNNYEKEEIEEILKELNNEYPLYSDKYENDCRSLYNNKLNKKSNGFGSIRIKVLMKNKVKFVDSTGKTQEVEDILKYLNDGNFTIQKFSGSIESDECD